MGRGRWQASWTLPDGTRSLDSDWGQDLPPQGLMLEESARLGTHYSIKIPLAGKKGISWREEGRRRS